MTANERAFSLDPLAGWLDGLPYLHALDSFAGFTHAPADALPDVYGSVAELRTLLSLLATSAMLNAQQNEGVTVSTIAAPTSIDVAMHVRPGPLFMMLYKSLNEIPERQHPVRTIQTSPDALITLLLARKCADRTRTRVWVQLEKDHRAGIHAYVPTLPAQNLDQQRKPTVLIIEDTKMIGNLMELYLRQNGFKTMFALNGVSGLDLAREHRPDMITLDVMMPEMDGWQVLLELKSDTRTRDIPVVIVSVLRDRQIGFELGAADYLTKPVVREELIACAQRLTAPATASVKSIPASPRHWTLFTGSPAEATALARSFPDATLQTIDIGVQKFFDTLLDDDTATPDLLVVDFRQDFHKAYMALCRLRLYDPFDTIPIIGIASDGHASDLAEQTASLVDFITTASALAADPAALAQARMLH